jgi:hypothetical protein
MPTATTFPTQPARVQRRCAQRDAPPRDPIRCRQAPRRCANAVAAAAAATAAQRATRRLATPTRVARRRTTRRAAWLQSLPDAPREAARAGVRAYGAAPPLRGSAQCRRGESTGLATAAVRAPLSAASARPARGCAPQLVRRWRGREWRAASHPASHPCQSESVRSLPEMSGPTGTLVMPPLSRAAARRGARQAQTRNALELEQTAKHATQLVN